MGTDQTTTTKPPLTTEQKLKICLQRATYPRGQLEMIAVEMAEIMGVDVGSAAHRELKAAAYGQVGLTEALEACVNAKLAELAVDEVENQ